MDCICAFVVMIITIHIFNEFNLKLTKNFNSSKMSMCPFNFILNVKLKI